MKRWPSVVLLLLALGGIGTAFYFYRENRVLWKLLAALPPPPGPTNGATTGADAAGNGGNVETGGAGDATAAASTEVPPGGRAGRGGGRRGGDQRDRGAENLARMLTDPEMRAATLNQLKRQVDRTYGDLFVKLGLNEVQVETLRTLLAERQLAQTEAGMLQRTAETDAARDEARAWRDAKFASLESEINGVLGPDGMKVLADYQSSTPQRQAVEDIARRASYAGTPLSSAQSDRLVSMLAQVEKDVPAQNPLFRGWNNRGGDAAAAPNGGTSAPTNAGGEGRGRGQRQPLTQDAVSTYLTALDAQNQTVLQQAQEFLSAAQLEALADRQVEQYEQAQQQMDIALKNPDLPGAGFGGPGGGFGGGRGGFGGGGRGGPGP